MSCKVQILPMLRIHYMYILYIDNYSIVQQHECNPPETTRERALPSPPLTRSSHNVMDIILICYHVRKYCTQSGCPTHNRFTPQFIHPFIPSAKLPTRKPKRPERSLGSGCAGWDDDGHLIFPGYISVLYCTVLYCIRTVCPVCTVCTIWCRKVLYTECSTPYHMYPSRHAWEPRQPGDWMRRGEGAVEAFRQDAIQHGGREERVRAVKRRSDPSPSHSFFSHAFVFSPWGASHGLHSSPLGIAWLMCSGSGGGFRLNTVAR